MTETKITYQIDGMTKYWQTKASADRIARQLFQAGDATFWASTCDENGWFLEDLESIDNYGWSK